MLVIGIDFDGTLVEQEYPSTRTKPLPHALTVVAESTGKTS